MTQHAIVSKTHLNMELKKTTSRFIVIDLGTREHPCNFFCGYDSEKKRIVFCKKLYLRSIPSYFTQEPVVITVTQGETVLSGNPILTGPNYEEFRLEGLREIPGVKHSTDKILAGSLHHGDTVTIEKTDWPISENPMDILATKRSVGTPFKNFIFASQKAKGCFSLFFGNKVELLTTTVVLEDEPGYSYMNYF